MSKRNVRKPLAIFVAVAVVAGIGCAGAYRYLDGDESEAAAAPGGPGFCAEMPDAIGLYPGNPVTQMGFQVGKVSAVEQRGDRVRVSFALNPGREFPADLKVVTRSKSLLADRSLELVGNYAGGPTLRSGECVALQRSYTPKSISEITGSAADFIDAMSTLGDDSVQASIDGMDRALDGTGPAAQEMFQHAAAAAGAPDQVVADIGSSIMNMAPLTDNALQDWGHIQSILDRMPAVAAKGTKLFADVARFDRGIGWLVAVIYDIQRNYGADLWPLMDGGVADLIRLAATRAPDLGRLYGTIPSVAAALRYQEQSGDGLTVPYQPPQVAFDAAVCVPDTPCSAGPNSLDLLSLIAGKAAAR